MSDNDRFILEKFKQHDGVINALMEDTDLIREIGGAASLIIKSLKTGNKLLLCGNGGSAADAQHLETELVSKFLIERKALYAEAITVNTSTLTAIGNDYDYDRVFSRQIEAKGKEGDVLLAISTSGMAKNVHKAVVTAKRMGILTIGLTGNNKESLIAKTCDHCIRVPSDQTPRIQEAHILIGHIICEIVEKNMEKKTDE
ncbi:MAG: SIS domain-containing protein [Candidatus Margulisiibacteriota bacterium]